MSPVTVSIKPLVWVRRKADAYFISETFRQGPKDFLLAFASRVLGYYDSEEEAMAAGQAHHEERVRTMLVATEDLHPVAPTMSGHPLGSAEDMAAHRAAGTQIPKDRPAPDLEQDAKDFHADLREDFIKTMDELVWVSEARNKKAMEELREKLLALYDKGAGQ